MTVYELLRWTAERASTDRFFLASALLPYARAEGLDDAGLAERLGCAPDDLPALLLCRRPEKQGGRFRMDVERIAERFGLDPARLAQAIRLADALAAFGGAAPEATGPLLAAARDRDDAEHPPPPQPSGGSEDPTPPDREPEGG